MILGQRVTPIDKLVEQGPSLDLLSKPLFVLLHRQGHHDITSIWFEVSRVLLVLIISQSLSFIDVDHEIERRGGLDHSTTPAHHALLVRGTCLDRWLQSCSALVVLWIYVRSNWAQWRFHLMHSNSTFDQLSSSSISKQLRRIDFLFVRRIVFTRINLCPFDTFLGCRLARMDALSDHLLVVLVRIWQTVQAWSRTFKATQRLQDRGLHLLVRCRHSLHSL